MKELRAVVDTNIFVSALLGGRTPKRVYDAFLDGKFTPVFSPPIIDELFRVVARPEFSKCFVREDINRLRRLINVDTILVIPARHFLVCRDPKDDMLLDAAFEAGVPLITGDNDLLTLNPFKGIPIITPARFLNLLRK